MNRIGYILLSVVALLVIFTLALAQLETKSAKYLLRAISGQDVRGYYGTAALGPFAYQGADQPPLFAVSETGEAEGPIRTGKVYLYDKLLADAPVLTITAPTEGELFGWSLSAGDWNGDGIPDLAVGAPCSEGTAAGRNRAGKVYVYFGGADFGKQPSATLSAGEAGDGFGAALSMAQDLNGDSLADLVIGAPRSAKSGATSGRCYAWFGKHSGTPGSAPDVEIRLGTTNDLFGTCIATGDVNGDKQPDLLIGSPQHNIGEKIPGSVFVFFGGKGLSLVNPSAIISGETTSFQDEFGWSVAVVPDLNGDGSEDIIVGAPQVVADGKQMGKVYVYHGGQKIGPQAAQTFVGTAEAGRYGQEVYSLGDVNKDGKGDWAVQAESEAGSRGVLRFYYGGWDKEFYAFSGEAVGDRLGGCLAILGDLDKNGSTEFLVGDRWNHAEAENAGRAYILSLE
jgi:hypothetical protein